MQLKSNNACAIETKINSRDMIILLSRIDPKTCNVQEGTGFWKAVKDRSET